jgi:hypothetical protein
MRATSIALAFLACCRTFAAPPPDIPRLDWEERSDWVNVRTDVTPAALGNGQADDTAALQAALDLPGDGRSVYLPAGTYRITGSLVWNGPRLGCLLIGHGRDTKLVWDGPEGGVMLRSNGCAYSRFVGLSWDGRGRAAVGFDHGADERFETEVRHQHEAYRNFTGYGIRIGYEQKVASAEITYLNCLFERCGTGVGMHTFNDYNNTFDGCEFRDCGTGIYDFKGNFYARNCHFERSHTTDLHIQSEHGDSLRRCTSFGSKRFIIEGGTIAPLVVQDCHVAGWKDPEGAVVLAGAPVLVFDCVFSQPPSARPAVRLLSATQKLMVSQNFPDEIERLVERVPGAEIRFIPSGRRRGVVRSARQSFLRSEVAAPGKIFDAVRDYGAKGDGQADDTAAIQQAIDAAREHGRGAVAYLPSGRYAISQSLRVTGDGYTVGGSGFMTRIVWAGAEGGVSIEVSDPQDVTLQAFVVGHHDGGPRTTAADIRQTSSKGPSRSTYDYVFVYGMYQKQPDKQGILFQNLSPESVVYGIHTQGNLRFDDSAGARFLFANSYEGTVSVQGRRKERAGMLGFMMRLATISSPTVHVRDNQSLVMSDFYTEQSDRHLLLEGEPELPAGAVTIQGAKMHLNTDQPILEANGYHGRVYLGHNQLYIDPPEPKFITTGDAPLELALSGLFLYNVTPQFQLGPGTKLTLLANQGLDNAGLERPEGHQAIAAALDDLRRLGQLDHQINGWLAVPKGKLIGE